jgi:tRNA(fMet)-specific endonuclease VapC
MTGFMLDTDISSYIIKRRPAALAEKVEKHGELLNVSVITAAELRFGAEKAARPKLVELVEAYLERLAILHWTNEQQPEAFLERARPQSGSVELIPEFLSRKART